MSSLESILAIVSIGTMCIAVVSSWAAKDSAKAAMDALQFDMDRLKGEREKALVLIAKGDGEEQTQTNNEIVKRMKRAKLMGYTQKEMEDFYIPIVNGMQSGPVFMSTNVWQCLSDVFPERV